MALNQQTLAKAVVFEGAGLHSGRPGRVTVHPASANTGYRLRLGGNDHTIAPRICHGKNHCDTVVTPDGEVMQVEHLLGALWGLGVDNATIEVEGGEVPGMDGSAREFVDAIRRAGTVELDAPAEVFTPKAPIAVGDANAGVTVYPATDGRLTITYLLDYPQSVHARGAVTFAIAPDTVTGELACARTFVLKEHADAMLAAGLGQGANTQNTVVLDGDCVLDNALRFPDECARHKILDLLGDLATIGGRLSARVVAARTGHSQNLELARQLVAARARQQAGGRGVMDINAIAKVLPHRYPFLLIDRVLECEPRRRIVAIKNVTRNEEYFNGHFPEQPIMPGVLQIEALAQAGGLMLLGQVEGKKLALLTGVEDVRFRRQVVPGDQIVMDVELTRFKGRLGVAKARSTVDGESVVECVIKFALIDSEG